MKAVDLEKLLPADIPAGERVLWFGRPEPVRLWRRAFRSDWVAIWFVAMAAGNFISAAVAGNPFDGVVSVLSTLGFGFAALAILGFLAWLSARTTLYVVTQRRIVVKSGIALPIFINVPFTRIVSANVRVYDDGTGDIPVSLAEGQRIPYLALWPSARPLRFSRPEPMLRCIPDAYNVAQTLGYALAEAAGQQTPSTVDRRPQHAPDVDLAASVIA